VTVRPQHVTLEGGTLRITAEGPLPADGTTLAVAVAIRTFERFSALDAVRLVTRGGEERVTRSEVERLLAPEGFAHLRERGRWPQVLARAVRRRLGRDPDGGGD
jgi:hypothetical protein